MEFNTLVIVAFVVIGSVLIFIATKLNEIAHILSRANEINLCVANQVTEIIEK